MDSSVFRYDELKRAYEARKGRYVEAFRRIDSLYQWWKERGFSPEQEAPENEDTPGSGNPSGGKRSPEEQRELERYFYYLAASMPLSDVISLGLPAEAMLRSLEVRKKYKRAALLPDALFFPYVLSLRVNDEELEPFRSFIGQELDRYFAGHEDDSETRLALEINYYAASLGSYRSTDERTCSAAAFYRKGYGRCGEESVFVVNLLRAMGIPARQVYAPYWAHCEDNHAWVELYADGAWHFMGACEPQERLDIGWFNDAASRAMLIHSRYFPVHDGDIPEGEEIIGRDGRLLYLNQTARYAKTRVIEGRVTAAEKNAPVYFSLCNGASLREIAAVTPDREGNFSLRLGLGSVFVRTEFFQEQLFDTRSETKIVLGREADARNEKTGITRYEDDSCTEGKAEDKAGTENGSGACRSGRKEDIRIRDFTLYAPESMTFPDRVLRSEEKRAGALRLAEAEKKRQERLSRRENPVMREFLDYAAAVLTEGEREQYLAGLTLKDRDETRFSFFREDLKALKKKLKEKSGTEELTAIGREVTDLRIYREPLGRRLEEGSYASCPYGTELLRILKEENPEKAASLLWSWIREHISSYPEEERKGLMQTPEDTLRALTGSELSQKILFVALLRSQLIPAGIRSYDEALMAGKEALLPEERETATLRLMAKDRRDRNYEEAFSLHRKRGHGYRLLRFPGERMRDGSWEKRLPAGEYRLILENRLPNGNIVMRELDFSLRRGEEKLVPVSEREVSLSEMLERIELPEEHYREPKREKGQRDFCGAEDLTLPEERFIELFLLPGEEPTQHILNELLGMQEEWEAVQEKLHFIVRAEREIEDPLLSRVLRSFPRAGVFIDPGFSMAESLARKLYLDPSLFPLNLVKEGKKIGIFASSGYNVGMSMMLYRILRNAE